MMTREEEYYRTRQDRDDAEREVDELEEQLFHLEEETEEWYDIHSELNNKANEAMYLTRCLEDYVDEPYYANEY